MLEREIPQLQEIAGKTWKKEDELKQLKSELAALDRKIQLDLAPPILEVTEKENDGKEINLSVENMQKHTKDTFQLSSSVNGHSQLDDFITDHIIIGQPGFNVFDKHKSKGIKL